MPAFASQDPPILSFSTKRTPERLTYGFDFRNVLGSGESITSAGWSIVSVTPTGVPVTGMLVGSSTISGTRVFQQIQSGTDGVLYSVVCQITTNYSSPNIIEENALLPVSNSAFK
jgi:hypothetical protein